MGMMTIHLKQLVFIKSQSKEEHSLANCVEINISGLNRTGGTIIVIVDIFGNNTFHH